jgi:hypothetical protein
MSASDEKSRIRIQIRTQMSRIHSTGYDVTILEPFSSDFPLVVLYLLYKGAFFLALSSNSERSDLRFEA